MKLKTLEKISVFLILFLLCFFLPSCREKPDDPTKKNTSVTVASNAEGTGANETVPIELSDAESVGFSAYDFSEVDRIILERNEEKEEITIREDLDAVLTSIKLVKGNSAESSRGYSGLDWYVRLFCGDKELYSMGFQKNEGGDPGLFFGWKEIMNGNRYHCRYRISVEAFETVDRVFARFCK